MSVKQGGKSGGFKTPQPEANLKKRKKEISGEGTSLT